MQLKIPFLLPLFFFCIVSGALSQEKSSIVFADREFDFGTVRETDSIIDHDFLFTNEGKVPLILNDVTSSCGCTAYEWSREPILPGKSGTIKVSFNPSGQSGAINKTIRISSNAVNPQVGLTLKGIVIPVEKISDKYKFSIADLRLATIYASFGEVYKGKPAKYDIRVFNTSESQPVELSFGKIPPHLRITIEPELIEPQQEGIIEIEYLTDEINSWDYAVDRIDLLINGKAVSNNRINVTANIKEDFSDLTAEQLDAAARVEFDSRQFDFGTITDDKTVEHSFILTNTGKSNLYIRKVTASCGCTAVQPAKTTVLPGESTEIKAVFNARGREGNQKKAITVITNDPKHSRSILWISAVVERKTDNP